MRTICAINNYNYANYLSACLDSALAQGFDKIIVVDDGSTDHSHEVIKSYASRHESIFTVLKSNGGQLSAFEAVLPYVAAEDLVFFLDADDLLPANYRYEIVSITQRIKADFYFCKAVEFRPNEEPLQQARINDEPFAVLEKSRSLTLQSRHWVGSPTSALTITGSLLHQLLPYPDPLDWKVRADDVLVFGAAILSARKVYLPSVGISYRIHGKNLFSENPKWAKQQERDLHDAKIEKLLQHYCCRQGIPPHATWKELRAEMKLLPHSPNLPWRYRPSTTYSRFIRHTIKKSFFNLFS